MDVVALVSGGKDSCYAMLKCVEYGHKIVALANLMPADDAVDELDSYMYQSVGHQIVVSYAACMGVPLFRRRIQGSTRNQHLRYVKTPGDEVEDMFVLLSEVKRQLPSVAAVSSGAIASDYQRLRVENVCSRLRLVSLAYLWKQDQSLLLQEMISKGIVAILIKVAAMGLDPGKHLGKDLVHMQPYLHELKRLYGINVCGEGGEYETLTLDCSLFKNARIVLDEFKVLLHSPDSIAPVGVLHPLAFHLEPKTETCTSTEELQAYPVHEVGENLIALTDQVEPERVEPNDDGAKPVTLNISRARGDTVSIGCWIQKSSGTSEDLQGDLTAALKAIDSELCRDGFGWEDVLYIHLYLANMKQFAAANVTYVSFIREEKCPLGVPSRSTIELPLAQVGLGHVYVEVLIARDQRKQVLHVQSISCWAPSCIGPYSQATLHNQLLYMAGQLGLDPSTMMLCAGGASGQLKQAMRNCEAVADSFNSDISSSGILLVIYCSNALVSSEKENVQKEVETLFRSSKRSNLHKGKFQASGPILLYVLVPDLPKGALVEVKPLLYIPKDREITAPTETLRQYDPKSLDFWGFGYMDWHGSCFQEYVIPEKLCMCLVSVSDKDVAQICLETGGNLSSSGYFQSEKNVRRTVSFCLYLIDKILFQHDFCWEDVKNTRVYFNIGYYLDAHTLGQFFTELLKEFFSVMERTCQSPLFNIIPVLGSGRSAAMEDLLTCEVFASKF